ncbi:MAG: efflux transporter outer membrane subunit [Novosphingobium sp.]|nr:efflux transporter outer membrane subunit [Novosphingobium sp.]
MPRYLSLIPILLLGACTVGPDFAAPAPPPPEAGYGATGDGKAVLAEGPDRNWWTAFRNDDLDNLVAQALAGNHSLAASKATLMRAREQINAVAGKRLPQVDGNARVDYQQVNLSAIGIGDRLAGAGIGNPEFDLYTVGGGVSYDLDLFGRNKRALEQAMAESEAQARETEAAHLVIAGRVVSQVLAIAALNNRIATERALLDEGERNVRLTETRRKAGAGTLVEVLSAQGQLAGDRTSLPVLEQQLAEGRATLAVLIGISPAELGPTDFSLDQFALPEQVPVAVPSQLVHKRPDILEAEARLHAATAAIGVATADLYPDITLGASITQSTSKPEQILNDRFNAFDLFGQLTAPIFDGGTRKARKRGAEANALAAAENYKQTVLEAFGQVSGMLSALKTDGQALATQEEAARIAERSLHLSRRSFEVGNSGILQVLDASRTYQRARIALVDARGRQYLNIARLYVATAGGWIEDKAVDGSRASENIPG